jgi:hypothetical protein
VRQLTAARALAAASLVSTLLGGSRGVGQTIEGPAAHGTTQTPPTPEPTSLPTSTILRSNLEPSYLAFPLVYVPRNDSLDPLWFEASIAPHFLVARPDFPIAFSLTPKILLRMYRERSAPVKTPSYMPSATVFGIFSRTFTGEPVFYGSLSFTHHSNGQAGRFFRTDGTINHESGDFSTNFVEAAFHVAGGSPRELWWLSPSLEWHPGINRSAELDGRYGFWRLHVAFTGFRRLLLDDKISVRLTSILDALDVPGDSAATGVLRHFPVQVRYIAKVPGFDIGAYVGGYAGPDYYNIWFDRYVTALQIGLSGDVSPTFSDGP